MRSIWLSNINRREFIKTASTAVAQISLLGCTEQFLDTRKQPVKKPNILFLMTDQQRGDCLGCLGNSVIKTPNIDSIAKQGVCFTNAYSSTPTCTPARSAILTGLSPWHHGMLGFGKVAEKYPFELPQTLNNAGYYTFGIGKMHWSPQRTLHGMHGTLLDSSGRVEQKGFISDYQLWFEKQAPNVNPYCTGIGFNDWRAKDYVLAEYLHPTSWTAQMAIDFIGKYNSDRPFMLKVSFARPHSPYDPPKRFMEMYKENDMPAPYLGKWADQFKTISTSESDICCGKIHQYSIWHGDKGIEQVKRSRRGYYGSISFIDYQVGRILASLKSRGFYDNTLIIFFSDHGDMIGDHYHWRKAYPYKGSAHIPMVLSWPKYMGMDSRRGKQLDQIVELRDVLPTFLDAAGAQIPDNLDGKSLLELVRGNTENWRSFIDLEHDECYSRTNHWNALTDSCFKYIFNAYSGQQQLFDLINDPGEIYDLAAETKYENTLKMWQQRMIEHFSERGKQFVADGKLQLRKTSMMYSPHYPQKT